MRIKLYISTPIIAYTNNKSVFLLYFKISLSNFTIMKNHFMLKLSLFMLMMVAAMPLTKAQDSLKKTVVKKTTVSPTKAGAIPINPKTGRPYTRYGYGAYAKTYKTQVKADSLKKT